MAQRSINIYNTEQFINLCVGLNVADCMKTTGTYKEDEEQTLQKLQSLSVSESLFCSFCNEPFLNISDQRTHYKLDWHRCNLKRKLIGRPILTKQQYEECKESGEVSSSNSEDETDAARDIAKTTESMPSRDVADDIVSSDSDNDTNVQDNKNQQLVLLATKHCQVYFQNAENDLFSIYRCMLHTKKNTPEDDTTLIQNALSWTKNTNVAVILLGGGHFAGAVFQGSDVVVHKTFHCYTVRAGQGGSQGARDSKGNAPKSAGSSLRRHNETALMQHVQTIMSTWEPHLSACHVVMYRASGPYNRQVLFSGKGAPLDKGDQRLRPIPFPTKRATFSEVKRVHNIVTTVEINKDLQDPCVQEMLHRERTSNTINNERSRSSSNSPKKNTINRAKSREVTERPLPTENLTDTDSEINFSDYTAGFEDVDFKNTLEEYGTTVPKAVHPRKTTKKRTKNKDNKNKIVVNEKQEDFRKKLYASVNLKDLELLSCCIDKVREEIEENRNNVERDMDRKDEYEWCETDFLNILNEPVTQDKNTLLHLASESGSADVIGLLLGKGADPCKKNFEGTTPYCMTSDHGTRNTFKAFRVEFPDKYNYAKSQIPAPITEDTAKEREERRKELRKAKREREKVKKQETKEKQIDEEQKERFLKLSDREKRALAAERRMLNSAVSSAGAGTVVLVRCFVCASDMTGKVPFEYCNNRFCTMECLKAHRMRHPLVLS